MSPIGRWLITLGLTGCASGPLSGPQVQPTLKSQVGELAASGSESTPKAQVEAPSGSAQVTLNDQGLTIESTDGASIRIGGRMHADISRHSRDRSGGEEISDGTELRRARIAISGETTTDVLWFTELEYGNNQTGVRDFWMAWEDEDKQRITVGHQKQPFSLGVEMSTNDMPFIERGVDNSLIVPFIDRAIGVRLDAPTENTLFSGGLYGEGVEGSETEDEGYGAAARYVYAPILEPHQVVHLGVRGAFRTTSSDDVIRIGTETTNQSNFRVTDTGDIGGVDHVLLYGLEGAWARGPFSLSGEFNTVDVSRTGEDLGFTSWHLAATYSLTGEERSRAYTIDSGEFKKIQGYSTATNPWSGGGAWELAARYATVDLQDGGVAGGEQDALSLGLNWYANSNVRFLLDWTHVLETRGGDRVTDASEGLNIFLLRAQITF